MAVFEDRDRLSQDTYERLMDALSQKPTGDKRLALIYCELADQLDRLDCYERRALSRRRKAIRAFDLAARRMPGSRMGAETKPEEQGVGRDLAERTQD